MFRRGSAIIIVLTMIAALVPIPSLNDDGGSGSGSARADGGMIPYYGYSLNEPGQKAIIGWNGEEEVMLLSVDVWADYEIKALHVVPFPTLPEVTLGSNESFGVVENITDRYRYESYYDGYENDGTPQGGGNESAYDMVFYDSIGPHDITVMRVNDSDEFTGWVDSFLQENDMGWEYNVSLVTSIIDAYVEADIRYFAFDVIDLGLENRTVDPLVYRFRTDSLFFPLHISSMIEGYSEVALALITPQDMPMSIQQLTDMSFHRILNIRLSRAEVEAIDGTIAGLFPGEGTLSMFHREMHLPSLSTDISLGCGIDGVKWRATCLDNRATFEMGDVNGDGVDDVVSCCYDGLHVIDGRTGGTLWTYEDRTLYETEIDHKHGEWVTFACDPVLVDVNLDGKADVVCYSSGNITALNGPDGSLLWENRKLVTGEPEVWSADMDADEGPELVLVDDNGVKVIAAENGTLQWSFNTHFGPNYRVMEIADLDNDPAMEVLASRDNKLYALNGGNGSVIWTHDMEHEWRVNVDDDFDCPTTAEVINLDGKGHSEVVVVPGDMMSVLDSSDGSVIWEYTNPGPNAFLYHIASSDVDGDGSAEVLFHEENTNEDHVVYALDSEDGGVEWSYDTEHGWLSRPQVGDVDNDGTDEVIVRYVDYDHQEFYIIDGDGSELWTWDGVETWNYWMSILDEDIGGRPVVLAIVEDDLKAYDGSDGTHLWTFDVDYDADFRGSYADLHDIDGDGDDELVARLGDRLHFLEPEGLTPLLNLTTGESLDSYTIGDFNDDGKEEVMALCSGAFYCFGDESPYIVLKALNSAVTPGGDTSLVVYFGDGSYAVTGSTIAMSDNGAGGTFSEVVAQGGGIHTCNYTAPPTAIPGATINITASAETAGGTITSNEVLLTVIEGGTEPDPGEQPVPAADRMTMDVASVEPEWLSGTSADIIIGISNGTEPVDNATLFVSADVEGGAVRSTETVGQGLYHVTYQLPEGFAGNLTIYVLATHRSFEPAVGAVVLAVVEEEAPVAPVEPGELLFKISAFPATPYEGDTIALLLGLLQGDAGLDGAYFDLDDSGAGGLFSEPDGMGGGYYSLQYDPPEGYVGEINITGTATPGNGSFTSAYMIITIVERPGSEEPNASASLKIYVDTLTGSCLPGGACAWMIYASAGDIPVEGAAMELSDVLGGGSFDGSAEFSGGYYIIRYSAPESMAGDINISIRLTSTAHGSDRVWVHAMLEGGAPGGGEPEDGADEAGDKDGDADEGGVTPIAQGLMILLLVLIMLANVLYWRRQKGGQPGKEDKDEAGPSGPSEETDDSLPFEAEGVDEDGKIGGKEKQ